jgi:hypothetical protein
MEDREHTDAGTAFLISFSRTSSREQIRFIRRLVRCFDPLKGASSSPSGLGFTVHIGGGFAAQRPSWELATNEFRTERQDDRCKHDTLVEIAGHKVTTGDVAAAAKWVWNKLF